MAAVRRGAAMRWLVLLALAAVAGYALLSRQSDPATRPDTEAVRGAAGAAGDARIVEAFRQGRSDLWVETEGRVERSLADDLEGSRHQRFVLRMEGGHTLLVSHNIDLAPRVPLSEGDRVELRGEYEWNERGGVVHWTHHDPEGRHSGGWIRHEGELYR